MIDKLSSNLLSSILNFGQMSAIHILTIILSYMTNLALVETTLLSTVYSLFSSPGHWSSALQPWLSLLGNSSQQLLDLSNSSPRVEAFGAGLGAVHDGVTPVNRERISEFVKSLSLLLIPTVNDPPVGLHEDSRSQVPVTVPPVGRTGGGATSTQDTLVQTIQLGPVID